MTDITQANGHRQISSAEPAVQYPVRAVIEGIQSIHDEQRRELDAKDNMIELLRAEADELREERDFYLRKSVALAQQMKSVAQLCEEGKKLAEAADRLEREVSRQQG